MKCFIFLFIILLAVPAMAQITQPEALTPEPTYQSILTQEGTACDVKYSTSEGYCSGGIRQYFQCLPTVDGLEWQQRSENCNDYGGSCVILEEKAQCSLVKAGMSTTTILLIAGGVLIFLWIVLGRKR